MGLGPRVRSSRPSCGSAFPRALVNRLDRTRSSKIRAREANLPATRSFNFPLAAEIFSLAFLNLEADTPKPGYFDPFFLILKSTGQHWVVENAGIHSVERLQVQRSAEGRDGGKKRRKASIGCGDGRERLRRINRSPSRYIISD
jgi:hypothetical protein